MAAIDSYSQQLRETLRKSSALGADLFVLLLVGSLIGGMLMVGKQFSAPFNERIEINLSLWALPLYTLFSLARGFAAYFLSLLFTLVYGTIAAHNPRAERLMIPTLDVLQAIPVLGFLPGLVMALVAIFPTREIGLELASIVMIFTGQVWNMTFSFHSSLRAIPTALREVAVIHRLTGWQTFRLLEVPAAMIGLVWNSMMSMAGGWFFLTVAEAFTLGNHDFRLPGIGSYMNEAIHQGNTPAMLGALVAMVLMILFADQVVWRPIVVWSQRFKLEDWGDAKPARSWVLELMQRSLLVRSLRARWSRAGARSASLTAMPLSPGLGFRLMALIAWPLIAFWPVGKWLVLAGLAGAIGYGGGSLIYLLWQLPLSQGEAGHDWVHVVLALGASLLRTSAAVFLGALWTLPVGIMIGRSAIWSQRLQPVIQVVASFPAPMLFPLVTLLLGRLHVPFTIGCVTLMLLGTQWYLLFNIIAGASAIPADLKEVAQIYHLSRWRRWTRLYIPCIFPYFVTGLVTAAGGAWNATIVSEYVQTHNVTYSAFGLGSTISHATAEGNYPLLTASVGLMALCVVLINRLVWKRFYRLAESRYSLNQ